MDDTRHSTEQTYVSMLYARLDELREQTRHRLADVRKAGPSGSPQNRSERDSFATLHEDRLAQLESVEDRLVFGRLDTDEGRRYIGRIGLTDAHQALLLTDWRAPAASAFYQATAAQPFGVTSRRHITVKNRRIVAVEDEVFRLDKPTSTDAVDGERASTDTYRSDGADDGPTLSGEGALMAALSQQRTGRMGDIVSTIQAEQDTIIRADVDGALVVQGGPGTGKTAVALHRAAYLLYTHRERMERSGVLIVGPSRVFLHYIDQVLPSLGETGVVSSTLGDLLPGLETSAADTPDVAAIKGRGVMAKVIARAARARQRQPEGDRVIDVDGVALTVHRDDILAAQERARRSHKPHNAARSVFATDMITRLAAQFLNNRASRGAIIDEADAEDAVRMSHDIRVLLNLCWMPLTPYKLLEDLFAKPALLEQAGEELSRHQRELLHRERGSAWTVSDVALLDEAAELLGEDEEARRRAAAARAATREHETDYAKAVLMGGAGNIALGGDTDTPWLRVDAETLAARQAGGGEYLTTAEKAMRDRRWVYGHIVVDEAQELSPMEWRMLLRRCPTRSMTIVGDVGQTHAIEGTRAWRSSLGRALGRSWRLEELTINYRTPATIMAAAERMARGAGLDVTRTTSARDVEDALRVVHAPPYGDDLVRQATALVEGNFAGRVAIIVAPDKLAQTLSTFASSVLADRIADPGQPTILDAPIAVMPPDQAKGLEFDDVIVCEPADIFSAPSGPGDLYVAMTRPTQKLVIIHEKNLPAGIPYF